MNKIALSIVALGLVVAIGVLVVNKPSVETPQQPESSVEVREGVQYVTIYAKGGYSPRVSTAQAGIPTKLVVKTNGTYDCSAALVIRSLGYQNILPSTGEEVIDIGVQEAGVTLQGTCSMGMYAFAVNFN